MEPTRTVSVTALGDREIRVERSFDAPAHLVADAHTKPELLQRWMGIFGDWSWAVCEVDLRVGGAYRYVWRRPDGTEMALSGRYKEIVPGERYVFTQVYEEMPDFPGEMLVTLVLTEAAAGCALEMTVRYASQAERDLDIQYMPAGIEPGYQNLDGVLAALAGA
jgi:uncharacterized protein YndB with AHSA1/START domain